MRKFVNASITHGNATTSFGYRRNENPGDRFLAIGQMTLVSLPLGEELLKLFPIYPFYPSR